MSARLRLINAAVKPLAGRLKNQPYDDAKSKKGIKLHAPSKVAARTPARDVEIAGVSCVWLNEASAANGVLVYLHGGSYVTGPVGLQWTWPSALAEGTGMAALVVHYSLAPQHAYPVALDEVMAVLAELDGPVILMGDSAGGGLAVAAAMRTRDEGLPAQKALVLASPWLDVTMSNPRSWPLEKGDLMLSRTGLAHGSVPYAGTTDPRHPYVSPMFGEVAGLPPILLHVGDDEMFFPDNVEWIERCQEAGVDATAHVIARGFHVVSIISFLPEGRLALQQAVDFVKAL